MKRRNFIEIKIPKEIQDYRESIFFGLSLRQLLCSLLAVGAAVGLYFWLEPLFGLEATGWLCILGAAPFAACGFFRYHGMTAEKFLWAWLKSEFLYPKRLVFRSRNLYFTLLDSGERTMPIIKTLTKALQADREKFSVPRSVQDGREPRLPIRTRDFGKTLPQWPGIVLWAESLTSQNLRHYTKWQFPKAPCVQCLLILEYQITAYGTIPGYRGSD